MSPAGELDPVVIAARLVLLDALEAVGTQRSALILVGAQAVYMRAGPGTLAIAEYTRDADLAIDTERIGSDPQLDEVLREAGFEKSDQPGTWTSSRHTSNESPVPVDFLVAEATAGRPGRRAAVVPGQPENSARQVRGLEGVLVDNDICIIGALSNDSRSFELRVAGPAALIVAKVHKISERLASRRSRDKDALDIYRLLRAFDPDELGTRFARLYAAAVSAEPTKVAVAEFKALFGSPRAAGTDMVVRATSGLEPEDEVRRSTSALAEDLMGVVGRST
jgi:hypothetical protein